MRRRANELAARARRAVPSVLTFAGLGLLSAAAWTLALPAGLAAAGISCLVAEFLLDEPEKQEGG